MGQITSPAPIASDDLTLIDLQLFGPFDVKTEEAYANAEAQAGEPSAPEDAGDDAAQDDDPPQEPDTQDGAGEPDASDAEDEPAGDEPSGEEAQAATKNSAPSKEPEKLILGKFKSYEALEAAYEEAQRQLGRLHREIAEQRRKEQAAPKEPPKPELPPKTPEQIAAENRERIRKFLKDPAAYEAELIQRAREEALGFIQQTESQRTAREQTVMAGIGQVASKYSDFADLEPAVRAALAERPSLQRAMETLRRDPNATAEDFAALVEDAYLWAKSQSAQAALQSAREQGRQEATAALRQRAQANVARQGTRRDQTQETVEDRIKREILGAGRPRGLWGK